MSRDGGEPGGTEGPTAGGGTGKGRPVCWKAAIVTPASLGRGSARTRPRRGRPGRLRGRRQREGAAGGGGGGGTGSGKGVGVNGAPAGPGFASAAGIAGGRRRRARARGRSKPAGPPGTVIGGRNGEPAGAVAPRRRRPRSRSVARRGPVRVLPLPGRRACRGSRSPRPGRAAGCRATGGRARAARWRSRRGARGAGRGRRGWSAATAPAARSRTGRTASAGRGSSRRRPPRRPGWPTPGRTRARSPACDPSASPSRAAQRARADGPRLRAERPSRVLMIRTSEGTGRSGRRYRIQYPGGTGSTGDGRVSAAVGGGAGVPPRPAGSQDDAVDRSRPALGIGRADSAG